MPTACSHLIEPTLQVAWSETYGDPVPVEDSDIVEFDEASLFALDRFPGSDRREEGTRAALGIGYTRIDPLGWSAGIAAGIVLRHEDLGQFTPGSGLDGATSDWLLAAHFTLGDNRARHQPRALRPADRLHLQRASAQLAQRDGRCRHDLHLPGGRPGRGARR
jgi:lipopolysaccharide assembly outer membrane protein LptD (OstA)